MAPQTFCGKKKTTSIFIMEGRKGGEETAIFFQWKKVTESSWLACISGPFAGWKLDECTTADGCQELFFS